MGSFSVDLTPKYGLHPKDLKEYWPSESNGYEQYNKQVKSWAGAAYEEAQWEYSQNIESPHIDKYIEYLMGKQWPRERASYKSAPVDNRLWGMFWELMALMTDARPFIDIRSSDKQYDSQAIMINKCIRSWWMNSDADMTLAMCIAYGILSTGYAKNTWNPELRQGQGDFELVPIGPGDLLPVKARSNLQQSEMVVYKSVQSLGWFRRKFPSRGHLVKNDPNFSRYSVGSARPPHVPAMMWDMLAPQMRRLLGSKEQLQESVYPMSLYREYWFKDYSLNTSNVPVTMGDAGTNWCYEVAPGQPLYPRGRLIIMGGDEPMHDGPNPYWHGQFPFGALRLNVVPWQFMGVSELRPLIPLQDVVNNVIAGIMDVVKKIVNPVFFAPKNAFSDSIWDSLDWGMPGAKAAFNPMSPHKPEFGPAPVLPGAIFQLLNTVFHEMDRSSGLAAISDMTKKKQVPSGDTIDNIKSTLQTPIRLKARNTEIFLRDIGSQSISNVFQFYTMERRMYLAGEDGKTFEDFDWDPKSAVPAGTKPEDHAHRFVFMIQPGSLLNVQRVEKALALMRLRMMHDVDRKTMLDGLDLGLNADEIEKRLIKEAASMPQPPPGKGGKGAEKPMRSAVLPRL
jgi:hypothetical protein